MLESHLSDHTVQRTTGRRVAYKLIEIIWRNHMEGIGNENIIRIDLHLGEIFMLCHILFDGDNVKIKLDFHGTGSNSIFRVIA